MTRQNIHLIQNNHIYTIGLQKITKYAGFKFFLLLSGCINLIMFLSGI